MNPQHNETSGMQLPPPLTEQAPTPGVPQEAPRPDAEQGNPALAEQAPTVQAPAAAPQAIPLPMPPSMPTSQPSAGVAPTTRTVSLQASDDSDLIEKEWVNKAKQIVERTRDDPYRQSEELTVVKVDYMKKRYNKTIKLNK